MQRLEMQLKTARYTLKPHYLLDLGSEIHNKFITKHCNRIRCTAQYYHIARHHIVFRFSMLFIFSFSIILIHCNIEYWVEVQTVCLFFYHGMANRGRKGLKKVKNV